MKGFSYIENCSVSSEDLVHDSPKEASIDIQNASLVHLLVKVDDPNHCCKNLVRKKKKKREIINLVAALNSIMWGVGIC